MQLRTTPVLASTRYVVDHAQNVVIDDQCLLTFADTLPRGDAFHHWLAHAPFDLQAIQNDQDRLQFVLLLNALSFSYWQRHGHPKWTVCFDGYHFDGTWALIAALRNAMQNGLPLLDFSQVISKDQWKDALTGNVLIPMFEERWHIIQGIKTILLNDYGGLFICMIKKSHNDALQLISTITDTFPSFRDQSMYNGHAVYYWKKAQLLASDIHYILDGRGIGALEGIENLTACADYKLPQVLRAAGVIKYTHALSTHIESLKVIPSGSSLENEIRSVTIHATHRIAAHLRSKLDTRNITDIDVNNTLWLMGQHANFAHPYHRTASVFY